MDGDERKQRLIDARRAIFSRDPAIVEAACLALPATGAKAAALRERLQGRLKEIREGRRPTQLALSLERTSVSNPPAGGSAAGPSDSHVRLVDSGKHHAFFVAELDTLAAFSVRVRAGDVSIILNSDHPGFGLLALPIAASAGPRQPIDHLIRPGVRELLVAWSQLELGVDSEILRDRLRRTREDLGFALAEVVADQAAAK